MKNSKGEGIKIKQVCIGRFITTTEGGDKWYSKHSNEEAAREYLKSDKCQKIIKLMDKIYNIHWSPYFPFGGEFKKLRILENSIRNERRGLIAEEVAWLNILAKKYLK